MGWKCNKLPIRTCIRTDRKSSEDRECLGREMSEIWLVKGEGEHGGVRVGIQVLKQQDWAEYIRT